jgi:hypothetical protein
MMKRIAVLSAVLLLLCAPAALAQRFSLSTNLVEWANFGTANGELGIALSHHVSFHMGARYNPWTFRAGEPLDRVSDTFGDEERQFQHRKRDFYAGLRWWPWDVWSGWWMYGRAQWQEYSRAGLWHHRSEEGRALGGALGLGFTYILSPRWNIEAGAGLWGGMVRYSEYACANCGTLTAEGTRPFVLPDEVFISVVLVF